MSNAAPRKRRRFAFTFMLPLNTAIAAGAVGLAMPIVQPAAALPNSITCRITTYYNSADMETTVGVRTTCPGGSQWGRTSRHKEVEVVTLDLQPPGPAGGGGGAGGLPCEFLHDSSPANKCANLPIRRFGRN